MYQKIPGTLKTARSTYTFWQFSITDSQIL